MVLAHVGKSTLLHLLLDKLEPTKGNVTRLGGVRTALFAQHHVQQLKLEVTPVEHLRLLFEDMSVQDCRNYLGTFGIRGMTATTQVRACVCLQLALFEDG